MVDDNKDSEAAVLPSIDEYTPDEQGGPIARSGFTYQDYVAARFFVQMIVDSTMVKVHCETQDDIVIVRSIPSKEELEAEFVQVKTSDQDSLWSAAKLCNRTNGKPNTSIFEKSLLKDRVQEGVSGPNRRFNALKITDIPTIQEKGLRNSVLQRL